MADQRSYTPTTKAHLQDANDEIIDQDLARIAHLEGETLEPAKRALVKKSQAVIVGSTNGVFMGSRGYRPLNPDKKPILSLDDQVPVDPANQGPAQE